ncbi:BQ5605_C001g00437 [Microbotryum silenes-dioicae]|uniref:BQ5605_C001g00437 protein n=2 Tax=Microbotryum TaxID=34416 RepID=A0A2X0M7I2_9BASI|nr:BQ5605_C001g00437 [Microbotryum silenes-dioicae]
MSVQSRDLEQVMENDFVLEWSSQRASAGYVCRYCGGERMWYRRAVRHATTKKHLDAYNSRADPAVNWTNRLLQPTPQALSSSDEADLVDSNQNPAETGTVGHSLLAVAGEIIKSSESVPASSPSPPSDHEDSVLDHALFLPEGNCSPYFQGTGSKSDSEVEIDGGAEEEESDDWVKTWATAGSTTVVTGSPAMPTRLGVRNYTSVPDSSHPWYPFPSQNMMIIVVFLRSHKRRIGVQELDDMLAFAKAFGVQEIPLFKPRQYTKEDGRSLHVVSPGDYVAAHFATPSLAPLVQHYPEFQPSQVDSAYHTRRWLTDLPPRFSAPMARVRGDDYFVDEIIKLKDVDDMHWFVGRFVSFESKVHAFVCFAAIKSIFRVEVKLPAAGRQLMKWPQMSPSRWCLVPVEQFDHPVLEIEQMFLNVTIGEYLTLSCNLCRRTVRSYWLSEHGALVVLDPNIEPEEPQRLLPLRSTDRLLAKGKLLLVAPLRLFLDDMAATESKRWNPMYTCFGEDICCITPVSPTSTWMPLISPKLETMEDNPIECYNSAAGGDVMIRTPVLYSVHDSPMAAACSARAGRGMFPCIRCRWGGSWKERLTEAQMVLFFKCTCQLDGNTTREEALQQIETYASGLAMTSVKEQQTSTGTHDAWTKRTLQRLANCFKKEMKHKSFGVKPETLEVKAYNNMGPTAKTRVKTANQARALEEVGKLKDELIERGDYVGPFFSVPHFDPHAHMPLDVLHVYYLGIVKYAWKATLQVDSLKKDRPGRLHLHAFLTSLSSVGLSGNIAAYHFIHFQGSLVGYDFVVLAQTMPLVAQFLFKKKLMPPDLNECWSAIGKLGHHLHALTVADLERYATECESLVNNVLQASMRRSLPHVLNKHKYHTLASLGNTIRMFGPPHSFDASLAESANKVIRQHNLRTNHHDVSGDIARKLGDTERVNFIARGGTWEKDGEQVNIGPAARQYIEEDAVMRAWLFPGSDPTQQDSPTGEERSALAFEIAFTHDAQSAVLSTATQLADTICFSSTETSLPNLSEDARWRKAKLAKLPNGDYVHPQDWCLFRKDGAEMVLVGQATELLANLCPTSGQCRDLVAFTLGRVGTELASTGFLGIVRSHVQVVVPVENVVALAVVQHNCSRSKCQMVSTETGPPLIQHVDEQEFLLSTIAHRSFDELANFRPPVKPPTPIDAFVRAILASKTQRSSRPKRTRLTETRTTKELRTVVRQESVAREGAKGTHNPGWAHVLSSVSCAHVSPGSSCKLRQARLAKIEEDLEEDLITCGKTKELFDRSDSSDAASSSDNDSDAASSTDNDSDARRAFDVPAQDVPSLRGQCFNGAIDTRDESDSDSDEGKQSRKRSKLRPFEHDP